MILELEKATSAEEKEAWQLYSWFVQTHLFSGAEHTKAKDEWDEAGEQKRFTKYWNSDATYSIKVDRKAIGWAVIDVSGGKATIENLHIQDEWKQRGVLEKILGGLIPKFLDDGLTIEAPLLKASSSTNTIENMLHNLGFKVAAEDKLTKTLTLS